MSEADWSKLIKEWLPVHSSEMPPFRALRQSPTTPAPRHHRLLRYPTTVWETMNGRQARLGVLRFLHEPSGCPAGPGD